MLVVSRTLVHHESATRGHRPPSVYRRKHEAFEARWIDVFRDTPIETALG